MVVGGGDGDDVGLVEGELAGEGLGGVEVEAVVARGDDEEGAGVADAGRWRQLRTRLKGKVDAAEAGVGDDDVDALVLEDGDVLDALMKSSGGCRAVGAEDLDGKDLDVLDDAGDADVVVADGADDAGDVGAVAEVVGGVVVALVKF